MGLTALDVIVLLLVGGGLTIGFLRGFVTEVLSLAAWVAAIVALKFLHTPTTDLFGAMVGTRGGAAVLAFAVVFLIVFIGTRMLAQRLGGYTRGSLVGPVDRVLGGGFGALKGLIGATLLFLLASLIYDTAFGRLSARPAWMTESRSYPLLNATGRAIVDFVEARRNAGAEEAQGNLQDDEPLRNGA
jgi:membrane protein required for colicin V production